MPLLKNIVTLSCLTISIFLYIILLCEVYTVCVFFLQQIDPCSYCRVFGEALDGDMLSAILEMLKNFYIRFSLLSFD